MKNISIYFFHVFRISFIFFCISSAKGLVIKGPRYGGPVRAGAVRTGHGGFLVFFSWFLVVLGGLSWFFDVF